MLTENTSVLRCLRCKGLLEASGVEPHRHICKSCGQNFHLVLQMIPVEPLTPFGVPALPEPSSAK